VVAFSSVGGLVVGIVGLMVFSVLVLLLAS
jgi:hypothetical protein